MRALGLWWCWWRGLGPPSKRVPVLNYLSSLNISVSVFFHFIILMKVNILVSQRKNTLERIEEAQQLLGERYLREKIVSGVNSDFFVM